MLKKCLCDYIAGEVKCLNSINATDGIDGRTALHLAARYDKASCIEVLLQAGADIEAKDNDNATPLTLACWKTNCASIQLLQSFNARADHLNKGHRKNINNCFTGT